MLDFLTEDDFASPDVEIQRQHFRSMLNLMFYELHPMEKAKLLQMVDETGLIGKEILAKVDFLEHIRKELLG